MQHLQWPESSSLGTLRASTYMPVRSNQKVSEKAARRSAPKSGCSVEAALGVIGGRWKGVVLYWLLERKHRFGELGRKLPNCSARVLTLQLRELEEDGLVKRTVYPEVPPRVEYELTAFGRSLEPVLLGLKEWGKRYERRLP
jgi:DNA-binding HxlR family transcriptional regulator